VGSYKIHNLLDRVALDLFAAGRAVDIPHTGIQQTHVVIYFCDCPHCGAGVLADRLLFNADSRGEVLDGIHVGFFHQLKELAGISGKRFHVSSLPFSVESVKGEGGLAGA